MRLSEDELKDLRKQVEKGGWHDVKTEDGVARPLPRQGRLPADRLRRPPGRLLARLRTDARPQAARRCGAWRRSAPRSGGARTPRPAPTASASGSRRRTRSSPASACATVLRPQPGERVLEIGPGTGYYTLDMAEWVGPEGKVEIFDLQQEFLDHTMRPRRRARPRRTSSRPRATRPRSPTRTPRWTRSSSPPCSARSPTRSPPCARSAACSSRAAACIVGELFGDPHFTTQAALERQAAEAGLAYEERLRQLVRLLRAADAGASRGSPCRRCA